MFVVGEDVFEKVNQDLWAFRDRDIIDVSQDQIARLEIRRPGEEMVFRYEDFRWIVEKPESREGQEVLAYKL